MNYILLFVFFFYMNLSMAIPKVKTNFHKADYVKEIYQTSPKTEAFAILRDKCNVCHATKRRTDIFTLENMDSLAQQIHEQVFIKEKMPKGRKVKLTEDELSSLKKWLKPIFEDIE